ncbi:tail sheath [Providencia phage PSTRCR_121]|nr:tail sheath [Providencia phage PSTRCR_121]
MALLSPGIELKETSVQSTIVRGATGRAAMAGKFSWGPAFQVTQITSEVELVDKFGLPNNETADYFMSVMNFLQYGNDARVVRAVNREFAKNASPLYHNIESTIVSGGSNYTVGDKVVVKYNNKVIEDQGLVTKVSADSKKIEKIFIPSAKIIAHAKAINTYPLLGAGWTAEVSMSTSGVAASITLGGIVVDSGILLTEAETSIAEITSTKFQEKLAKYGLPGIVAIYPGERGSTIEVEVVSYDSYNKPAPVKVFPDGGERSSTARQIFQYGPQNENQVGLIVRIDGAIHENVILSTKRGDKDVYGNNIFMDDYFSKGSSNYLFGTATGWPKGFSGIIKLGGGVSANSLIEAGDLMQAWDHFGDRESLHVNLMIAGSCAGETEEIASTVQKHVISIADERKDCLVLVSPPKSLLVNVPLTKAVDNMVKWRRGVSASGEALDSNMNVNTTYAAIDTNYKYQYDKYNDVNRWVPLAADIAGLCARTDSVAQPWMSPAGYVRGQILNCIKLAIEPRQSHRDELYQLGMNPVTGFAGGEGFVLFGDKTATTVPSPFDHINVRRLFNMLKKNIGDSSKYKLFEINDDFTRKSFRMEVSQYLNSLKSLGAMYDFRVICDTTNNTPTVIDRGEFVATIYIKPARSINYITLNFVATDTGADFDELIGPQNL